MGANVAVPLIKATARTVIEVAVNVARSEAVRHGGTIIRDIYDSLSNVVVREENEDDRYRLEAEPHDTTFLVHQTRVIGIAKELAEEAATLSVLSESIRSMFIEASRPHGEEQSEKKTCDAPDSGDEEQLKNRYSAIYTDLLDNIEHFLTNIVLLEKERSPKDEKKEHVDRNLTSFKGYIKTLKEWVIRQRDNHIDLKEQNVYRELNAAKEYLEPLITVSVTFVNGVYSVLFSNS